MDCKQFDEQVVRLDGGLSEVAKEFVLVRLNKLAGMNLEVFDFDFDLTWAGFFMDAEERIYGRYGGRDAGAADKYLSLAGLKYAMAAALEFHRSGRRPHTMKKSRPVLAEEFPAARRLAKNECIHCHQVYEFARQERMQAGTWEREERWKYPPPRNVGLSLEVDRGDRVATVAEDSPAARAGVRPGDRLRWVNGLAAASIGDVQYALHRAPAKGSIPLVWERDGARIEGNLELPAGWRKSNITWRASMLELLPSCSVNGDDLSGAEKKALGLTPKALAFRQDEKISREAAAAGIRAGDIVLGIDDWKPDMTMVQFSGHIRQNYLVGDRISLAVLRDGKHIQIPVTLR